MEWITDRDILKFFSTIQTDNLFKTIEANIDLKKDIFGQKNAKNLLKLISQKQKHNKSEFHIDFTQYDIWSEGKVGMDSLALLFLRNLKMKNCKFNYESFIKQFLQTVENQNYQQYHRFDVESYQNAFIIFQGIVDYQEKLKNDLRMTYQNNLIKELENQITISEINRIQTQQTPFKEDTILTKLNNNHDVQHNVREFEINIPSHNLLSPIAANKSVDNQLSQRQSDQYMSLTSEKDRSSQKPKKQLKKKGTKLKKAAIPTSNHQHINMRECEKMKKQLKYGASKQSPIFLKKHSYQSHFSNISSSSDLMSFRKVLVVNSAKKTQKKSQSSEKIKQQSLEITKLSQKVQEIESKMTQINTATSQVPQKTIIEIRERPAYTQVQSQEVSYKPSLLNSLASTGLAASLQNNQIPSSGQSYFIINNTQAHQNRYHDELQNLHNINRNILLSARRYDMPMQQSNTSGQGLRLGQSLEKYDHIRQHQKCTSKFCLICKQ
eukprot:403361804